jgi:hypothetical protein
VLESHTRVRTLAVASQLLQGCQLARTTPRSSILCAFHRLRSYPSYPWELVLHSQAVKVDVPVAPSWFAVKHHASTVYPCIRLLVRRHSADLFTADKKGILRALIAGRARIRKCNANTSITYFCGLPNDSQYLCGLPDTFTSFAVAGAGLECRCMVRLLACLVPCYETLSRCLFGSRRD